jgi:two-component system, OmpR family, phosphate regulon sensor histidine kinase PhoR
VIAPGRAVAAATPPLRLPAAAMAFGSPLYRKLFLGAVVITGVTLAALDFYLTRFTSNREIEKVRQGLLTSSRILGGELGSVPPERLEAWALEAGGLAKARVTVIDPAGKVLADSQHDPETMENHAGRPEIREAVARGTGSSIRHSATLDRDLCYFAYRTEYAKQTGFVLRLAVPLEDVEASVAAVRFRILVASLLAALLALAFATTFSGSLTRRIERLRKFAESLVTTPGELPLEAMPQDELGMLARALNRTSVELGELVERVRLESGRREAILSGMVDGVLAVDGQMRVTFSNASFLRALGRTGTLAQNAPLAELVRDPELRELLAQVLKSGEPSLRRIRLTAAEPGTFEVQAAPLAGPTGRGAIAILHDVTHLERLERVRSDFVANVSHELRTPLTAIRGYAETLLEGAIDDAENNRKFLEIIKAHAIRLNNIASDLLTLSELESGSPAEGRGEVESVSVGEAMDAALRTVESEARLKGVTLIRDGQAEARVSGNRVRLEQALINLLDNAIKFNRSGGTVRAATRRDSDSAIRITVADTGIGIPSEHVARIFERFYRVDRARSRELGGTGLGLSIVKHVVERMGGSVSVESRLGQGSTFTILLPHSLS